MKNTYLNLKSTVLLSGIALFCSSYLQAQVISWNGYTQNTVSPYVFNSGTAPDNMSAVVTVNNVTRNDDTPKYVATATTSGTCYTNGLALNAGSFSSYLASENSHFTVTMTFNPANVGGVNGTCNSADFSIRDINSLESNIMSFLDVVEISAIDGNGNAIPTSNITTTLAGSVTRVNSGTTVRLVGHNSASETTSVSGSFSNYSPGANCADTRIVINPGTNTPLRSITIKYRPAYGTNTGNAYYNINPRPAVQYISISNITLNSTGTCPSPLPVELSSFTGESMDRGNLLKWETATEKNNSHFELERSTNGEKWETISNVPGAGTTVQPQSYSLYDNTFEHIVNYYRLKQVDYDGSEKLSDILMIDNSLKVKTLEKIVNTMGQEVDEHYKGLKIYLYTDGTIVKRMD